MATLEETKEELARLQKEAEDRQDSIRRQLESILAKSKNKGETVSRFARFSAPEPIDESIKKRKSELDNLAYAQDIQLKRVTLLLLFIFLATETLIIFIIAFFQGFSVHLFHLDEWSFNLIIFATISQITTMLLVAVKHLFPQKKEK
jgi:hypothetical protein